MKDGHAARARAQQEAETARAEVAASPVNRPSDRVECPSESHLKKRVVAPAGRRGDDSDVKDDVSILPRASTRAGPSFSARRLGRERALAESDKSAPFHSLPSSRAVIRFSRPVFGRLKIVERDRDGKIGRGPRLTRRHKAAKIDIAYLS